MRRGETPNSDSVGSSAVRRPTSAHGSSKEEQSVFGCSCHLWEQSHE